MPALNDRALHLPVPTITARPTSEEKRRFADIARRLRISESALALIAIRTLLDSNLPDRPPSASTVEPEPAIDRITIRLRPGDRSVIRRRAAERRMKDSAYIAALVRGHVSIDPPLTTSEIAALKMAVSVLAGFGRLLARATRDAAQAGVLSKDLQQDLSRTRALVADVERCAHEFARAALITWKSRIDQASRSPAE